MGGGKWTSSDWDSYKTSRNITSRSTVKELYTSSSIKKSLNPRGVKIRESRDSEEHPNSSPIILGLDVTGSMGYLAEEIAKTSLNEIIMSIYKEKPIEDPQIMIMAIGDAFSDSAPLQVSQFESDIRIAEQLSDVYFEGCGGGNGGESYLAAWYFAARHTDIDSYELHGRKGYLFTIGDEPDHKYLTREQIKNLFDDDVPNDLTEEELLKEVSEKYNVYHICVGDYAWHNSDTKWKKVLGERVTVLNDHTKIPKVIKDIITLTEENAEKNNIREKVSSLPKKDDNELVMM